MFRLVKFPVMRTPRSNVLFSQFPTKVCTLCGVNNVKLNPNLNNDSEKENTFTNIDDSTKTNILFAKELEKRRKLRKDKRYFMELLEVSRHSSRQLNVLVENMKAIDFPMFAEMADLKFTRSPRVKKKSNSKKVLATPAEVKNKKSNKIDFNKSTVMGFSESFARKERIKNHELKSKNNLSRQMCTNREDIFDDSKHVNIDKVQELKLHKINDLLNSLHKSSITNVLNDQSIDQPYEEDIAEELENQPEELINNLHTVNNDESSNTAKKTKPVTRKKSVKQAAKEKLAKDKVATIEKKYKEEAFNTTLLAFIKLCVSCNLLQRGIATLHYYTYRSKMSANNPKVTDIKIFEELMKGFAAKGNQAKLDDLCKLLVSCGLEPTLGVFMSQLECAARSPKDKDRIPEVVKSLRNKGYELQQIFLETEFLGNQREVLLKALKEVEPDFKPLVPPPNICYSCSLLKDINDQKKSCNIKSPVEGLLNKTDLQKFSEEQFNNEFSFYLKVKSIEKRIEPEDVLKINRQKLDAMRTMWMKDLKNGFERDMVILGQMKKSYSISLLPYLKVLSVQSYVDIMLKEIQRLAEGSETFSPTTLQLYRNIGNQVRNRYVVKYKKAHGIVDKTKMLYDKYCDWYLNPTNKNLRSRNSRQEWQHLLYEHPEGPTLGGVDEFWPGNVMIGIGRFLYNIIIGDVKVDVNVLAKANNNEKMLPAFYRVYRQQGVKNVEEIKPHPVISKLFRAAGEEHIHFDITLVPMVSPPLPWTSPQSGGYLMSKTDIIRLPDQALQQRVRLKEVPPEQLYPSLDSLNQLGSIPWKVNTTVLDTVIEVFNGGGSAKLDIPEPPHATTPSVPVHPLMSKQERFQAYRHRLILRRQKAEMYSLWCDALYKLSLANHFRDKVFWLPHNMDFRGRVYPCPPHLNHLGADMARSLLQFAQGKPLGPDGLDWLKIHLVNLLGTKKRHSIKDRLDYANTIMSDILDSANNPLSGKGWWMKSETPWQTLACCVEIRNALRHPDGPDRFVSHFPIHQDGSCNGLQHYAALGRDEAGAASVNLLPQDLPQDVYSCVAALVEQARIKDSAAGNKVAKELEGYVRRKVIKQTVMTTVYGVTRFGARLQIAKQLKDIDSFPKDYVWPASSYLVVKTFESLQEMFTSTKEIQDWFTECARLISQTRGENVEYVTPLGLPVVQHYSRLSKRYDYTSKLGHVQDYFPSDVYEKPNVMKQKNAFPPNFIHSLDSSHMMLTSIISEQRGITFVSVHDCYWTHACTVPIMNQICREQFVALHSQPILEDLSKFLLNKYDFHIRERMDPKSTQAEGKQRLHTLLSHVPSKGTFVLEHVLDSIYFFS